MRTNKGRIKTYLRRDKSRRHALMVSVEVSLQGECRTELAIGAISYNKLLVVRVGNELYGTYHYDSPLSHREGVYHVDLANLYPAKDMDIDQEFDKDCIESLRRSLPEVRGEELSRRGFLRTTLEEFLQAPQLACPA